MIYKLLSASNYRKKLNADIDLNDKEVVSNVLRVAWPSTLEALFIALISSVDTIMVATLGHMAISAVGIVNQPRMLILSIILALNMAVTVIVSRRKGQNNRAGANQILRNALILCLGLAFVLNILGFTFAENLLRFAGADPQYLNDAVAYFKIICVGNFFYSLSLTITAAQRGAGNTKISMITNLSANIVNIIFNYLLINGIWFFPRLEIAGAAIATAMGNVVALGIAIYSVTHSEDFLFLNLKEKWSLQKENLTQIFNIGWPSLIEQAFLRIGFFIFAKQVFSLGPIASSSHQITMNIMSLSFSLGDGLAIAATALVGRSLGQKKTDLAKLYGKSVQQVGRVLGIALVILSVVFRYQIINLFSDLPEIVTTSSNLFLIMGALLYFQMSQVITIGSLRGAGDVKFVAGLSMVSIMLVRPGLTQIFAYSLGYGIVGAWIGVFIDQLIRWSVSLYRYNSGKWVDVEV